jgi:hypothetical protein
MHATTKTICYACVALTIIMWVVTLITDPTPGPITAAAALTAIVALMAAINVWS